MIILGINDGHQSSAALCMDGVLVDAVSEERFSRRKNESGYPKNSIDVCLKIFSIESSDIDRVAVATKFLPPSYFLISNFKKHTSISALLNTSFNLPGELVVESPQNDLGIFSRCKLNNLIIDEWIISKK
jgi:predicted NodU family carbamoyl transferase